LEIATGVLRRVAVGATELADLRARLAGVGSHGAAPRVAGTHPVRGMERHGGLVPSALPVHSRLDARVRPAGAHARAARPRRDRRYEPPLTGGLADQRGAASRAAGEPKWTRNRFARDLALAPDDLIRRAITRLACP
jgi:hypothetical protein